MVMDSVMCSLVKEGVFGKVKYVAVRTDESAAIGAQFSSSLAFVNLVVRGPSGEEVLPLVVKEQVDDPNLREYFDLYTQFHNELIMYKVVLPSLGAEQTWHPKFYYGRIDGSDKDILVFENLKGRGFTVSREKLFLDYNHISLAMRKLATFHALSYILKHENAALFKELAERLRPLDVPKERELENEAGNFASVERGVRAFEKTNGEKELMEKFLNNVKYVLVVRRALSLPEEPFGVICHGDFCNNNILYKYDNCGRLTDGAVFDFQLSLHGTPAIDLAFFLYMHTTREMREKYWDDFLKIYWQALEDNVPEHIRLPSFQDFLKHFASRAVYGYLIAAFFIPLLMTQFKEDTVRKFDWRESIEERVNRRICVGGEEAEEKIRDVVSHLFQKRYIHAFLDFANNKAFVR